MGYEWNVLLHLAAHKLGLRRTPPLTETREGESELMEFAEETPLATKTTPIVAHKTRPWWWLRKMVHLRRLLRRIEKSTRRTRRWMWVKTKRNSKLLWRKVRTSISDNWYTFVTGALVLGVIIGSWYYVNGATSGLGGWFSSTWASATTWFANLSWWTIGLYVLGGVVTLLFLAWLWKHRPWQGTSGATGSTSTASSFKWGDVFGMVTTVAVVLIIAATVYEFGSGVMDFLAERGRYALNANARFEAQQARVASKPVLINNTTLPTNLQWERVWPVLAQCESDGNHFATDGSVKQNLNTNGSIDYGLLQINSVHRERWTKLWLDPMTVEGNVAFGSILFAENPDLRDWNSSRECWWQKLATAESTPLLAQLQAKETVEATSECSQPVLLATGMKVNMTPRAAVAYRIESSKGETKNVPAELSHTHIPFFLSPWFRICTEGDERVAIDVVRTIG